MKRFILVLIVSLVMVVVNLHAQQAPKSFERNTKDSINAIGDSIQSGTAQMPVYNPKDIDSKILVYKPKAITYNMPILGRKIIFLNMTILHI